jgi:hypothetical protein
VTCLEMPIPTPRRSSHEKALLSKQTKNLPAVKTLQILMHRLPLRLDKAHKVDKGDLDTYQFTLYVKQQPRLLTVAATPSLSRILSPNMNPMASSYPKGTS